MFVFVIVIVDKESECGHSSFMYRRHNKQPILKEKFPHYSTHNWIVENSGLLSYLQFPQTKVSLDESNHI